MQVRISKCKPEPLHVKVVFGGYKPRNFRKCGFSSVSETLDSLTFRRKAEDQCLFTSQLKTQPSI